MNVNRAVAVLSPPIEQLEFRQYCQRMKWRLLWRTFFVPLVYELGLQLVLFGDGISELLDSSDLSMCVDQFSNQIVVLQSVFVVDTKTRSFMGVRTWGQFITAKNQDALQAGIVAAGFENEANEPLNDDRDIFKRGALGENERQNHDTGNSNIINRQKRNSGIVCPGIRTGWAECQ